MHGYGSIWPMGGMMVGWLLLIVLAVGVVVWLATQARLGGVPDATTNARRILAERYARGELDATEYAQRMDSLR